MAGLIRLERRSRLMRRRGLPMPSDLERVVRLAHRELGRCGPESVVPTR